MHFVLTSLVIVDIITWQLYVGYGLDPNLSNEAWTNSFLDKITTVSGEILNVVQKSSFHGQVWVGEVLIPHPKN